MAAPHQFQDWLNNIGDDAANLLAWRERVLQGLLMVGLALGALVAVPSSLYSLQEGIWTIPVVDALALGWVALLLNRREWPYTLRAGSVVVLLYLLGLWFLITLGPLGQIYLMAFPVMCALMLGAKPAFAAVLVNALTVVGIGGLTNVNAPLPGLNHDPWLKWLVIAANFTFVDVLITSSVSVLLLGLEVALVRERRTRRALEIEQDRLYKVNEDLRLAGAAMSRLKDLVLISEAPFDPDGGRIVMVNKAFGERTGHTTAQVIGRSPRLLEAEDVPGAAEQRAAVERALENQQPLRLEMALRDAQGEVFWTETDLTPLFDHWGVCRHFVWVHRDVTEKRAAESRLRESEQRWKLALESAGDGVWDFYPQTGEEVLSAQFREMYGYGENELDNSAEALDDLTHPDDRDVMLRARQDHLQGRTPAYVNEHRVRCKDGSWKWVLSRGMVISRDDRGRPLRMIGTHTDITARKQAEALIWKQARIDPLTGMSNRQWLQEYLNEAMLRLQPGASFVLMLLDLDHFKEVNDTLGHHRGDELLKEAGRRIAACLMPGDLVTRMGGDEFTLVLVNEQPEQRAERCARDVLAALRQQFQLGDEVAFVSASLGLARFPQDADNQEALLRHADQALYAAKAAGRNTLHWFSPQLQEAADLRRRLANDLRQAVAGGQFEVHYQPIVRLTDGEVCKAEALLRWNHPQRGLVAPSLFIPIAESSGLIHEIGDWVFDQACVQTLRWRAQHRPDFQISVNRSPLQFKPQSGLELSWPTRLREHGLPGRAVVVEITEGLLLDAESEAPQRLAALREAGLSLALDDFGTGYSSLSYLKRYRIDFLKIDRVFVAGLPSSGPDMALCRAIIDMAHALDMEVIAEGVETAEQMRLLADAGCDFAQGHLFAPALPAPKFDAWLADRHKLLAAG